MRWTQRPRSSLRLLLLVLLGLGAGGCFLWDNDRDDDGIPECASPSETACEQPAS